MQTIQNIESMLETFRDKMLNFVLMIMGIAAFAGLVIIVNRAFFIGFNSIFYFQASAVAILIFVAIYRKILTLNFKILVVVFFALAISVSGFIGFGFLATSKIYVLVLPIFLSFFWSYKKSVITLAVLAAVYIIFALLYLTGTLEYSFLVTEYIQKPHVWLLYGIISFVSSFGLLYFGHIYGDTITKNFNEILNKNKELETYKTDLEALVKERTAELEKKSNQLEKSNMELEKHVNIIENQNEEIRITLEKLKELNDTKDKFFSIVSHDLKNPIGALILTSDMIMQQDKKINNEDKDQLLARLNSTSKYTLQLLNNLLQWSQVQTNRIDFTPRDIKLKDFVDEIIHFHREALQSKNLQVINHIPEIIHINADNDMLGTVFRNLLTNSIKFSNEDGEIEFHAKISDGKVVIKIKDYGVGMREDVRRNLFKIDKVIRDRGTMGEHGTGLGLILIKEFIDIHLGSIEVESEVKKGTTIIITLPLK